MALAYNNTSIPPRGGIVNFNNASKEKVIFDNTTVWTMQKDLIITNGATSYYGAPRYGSGDGPSTAQTSMTSQGWRIYNDSRCAFGLPTKVTFTGFTTLKFTIVKNSVFQCRLCRISYRSDIVFRGWRRQYSHKSIYKINRHVFYCDKGCKWIHYYARNECWCRNWTRRNCRK